MVLGAKENVLYELAQAMATNDGQSAAVALRKLAQAGYGSLDEVDSTSDWILLSIPGLGVGRLDAVRRLTRLDWQPPSSQAVKAVNRFVSSARLALRYWPAETLAFLTCGSTPEMVAVQSFEKQLVLNLFIQATQRAQRHCALEELVQVLWQATSRRPTGIHRVREPRLGKGVKLQTMHNSRVEENNSEVCAGCASDSDICQDSDHFAHPRHKRLEIVRNYWIARERRGIKNKDAWARSRYQISGKTLLCYEREFQDQRHAILAAADGG